MNLFVITNCGSTDIEIIGVMTIRPNTCFGWKVEDSVSIGSWSGKFFISHQELPETESVSVDEDGLETITYIKNTSPDLIIGGYKIPAGTISPEIELNGEMVISVDGAQ